MFKTTRTMWLGVALLMLSCACPEKRIEGPEPTAKPAEPTPTETPTQVEQPSPEPTPTAPKAGEEPEPAATPTPPPAPPPATPAPATPAAQGAELPSKAGAPCDDRGCGGGFQCVSYYGIAGPKGPQFKSCEIPCPKSADKCPKGLACTSIADGPGRVCR